MACSTSAVFVHLAFSTKLREPLIVPETASQETRITGRAWSLLSKHTIEFSEDSIWD